MRKVRSKIVIPKKSRLSSKSSSGGFGGMRCDLEENQPKKRESLELSFFSKKLLLESAFSRTNLQSMKFQVKGGESELLGIDLKNVSLKRKITNDDSTVSVSVPPSLNNNYEQKNLKKIREILRKN